MNKYKAGLFVSLCCTGIVPFMAQADDYQTSVQCAYHHTLGDDAILMFGMPNHAMWHDFFGNTSTDASTKYETLQNKPATTCTDLADSSAYWAPSLRLPDGTEVRPLYQKTYYQTAGSEANPLIPFPAGLQLLAGDHKGTTQNPRISFLCNDGTGYSQSDQRTCKQPADGSTLQFNIGIQFPNCWDGKNIAAKPSGSPRKPNAVYSDDNGVCPADYPKHIPTVNMNIAYQFPGATSLDLRTVQLSLDPIMEGEKRIDQWGTLYTAHGDFINGWAPDAAKFMTERCMNNNYDCTSYMPYTYLDTSADTYVSNKEESDKNFGDSQQLLVQGDTSNSAEAGNDEKITLLKFKIPALPTNYPDSQLALFKYNVHLFGGRSTSTGAQMIYIYPTTTDWDEKSVTWNTRPVCNYKSYAGLYLDEAQRYRDIDVTSIVKQAQQQGQTEIAFCLSGDSKKKGDIYTFSARENEHYPSQLTIYGAQEQQYQ